MQTRSNMPVRSSIRSGTGGGISARNNSPCNNMWEMERRCSASATEQQPSSVIGSASDGKLRRSHPSHSNLSCAGTQPHSTITASASEDLHAWSIYRQNLNSDFTDSALGSSEKSPLPYGNFQLRESTVQSILSHPRYGPKSPLGSNMYTYLKFGLPRVFPPNGRPRDGSSGYDSSEDGGGGISPRTSTDKRQQSYYLRTRSDPDFRNQPYYGPSMHHHSGTNMRGKSISEANLLSDEALVRHSRLPPKSYRRSIHDLRAMSELGPPVPPNHYVPHPPSSHMANGRPASIAALGGRGNCHSMLDVSSGIGLSRGNPSMLDGAASSILNPHMSHLESIPISFPVVRQDVYSGQYPHLQIRGLDVQLNKNEFFLQSLSFEVKAGEVLAIMSTTAAEGKTLLDALSTGRRTHIQHIILNGQNVTLNLLKKRLVYVRYDSAVSPNLNVAQTLTFHSHLRQPPKTALSKTPVSEQIGLLIEELGLSQVLSTNVSELTPSEIQRLKIACYLLSDAEILLLDRPTTGMDIFDTFFLVEFLRQWANGGPSGMVGKAVILTLQPPTYEIFTMVSRVALISNGRMMFFGRRRDMLPYFASIDYPCPAYKNPSDYYLDLVTLDELSAEAMLESSQRIEQLAEVFRHRQEPLSDPGPPQTLPGKLRNASFFFRIIAIILRQMVYSQPHSFLSWISHLLIALFMSVFVGAIFWDIPANDVQLILNERISFHYTVMHVASIPILLIRALSFIHGRDRSAVESDISDNLYGRFEYIVITILCQLPSSVVIWLAYAVPSYAMSSLYQQGDDSDAFYIYISYMVLHMMAMQALLTLVGYLSVNRFISTVISIFVIFCISLTSGYPLHLKDIQTRWLADWLPVASPTRWILPLLLRGEFSMGTLSGHSSQLVCRNKVQNQDIIVQSSCPTPNGTAALNYYGLLENDALPSHFRNIGSVWMSGICLSLATLITILAFSVFGQHCRRKSQKVI